MQSLFDHIRTERGPVAYHDLEHDCAIMSKHTPTFPATTDELRRQLQALVRAGVVAWEGDVVRVVPERLPVEPQERQTSLF